MRRTMRLEVALPPIAAGADKDNRDVALQLYKMEYERCAERYENIYKALWTNFSYMAIVSGAMLTFGGERFEPEFSALLACLPLLFWWISSFEPLNHYGDHVAERLDWIEIILNETYGLWSPHATKPEDMRPEKWEIEQHKGLSHFTEFLNRKQARRHGADPRTAVARASGQQGQPAAKDQGRLERSVRFVLLVLFVLCAIFVAVRVGRFFEDRRSSLFWIIAVLTALLITIAVSKLKNHEKVNWEGTEVTRAEYFELTMLKVLRVRSAVRAFFLLLLIVAMMLAYRVLVEFPKEGKSLALNKPSQVKVAVGLKDPSGNIKLLELNAVEDQTGEKPH